MRAIHGDPIEVEVVTVRERLTRRIARIAAARTTGGVPETDECVRMLFDWLITGQIVPMNPAAAVRGPKHVVKTGKTPVLEGDEWRKLLASIPTTTLRDLRDRALIATLTYSFARITAALKMKVEDLRPRGPAWTVRLHEKGGKEHAMPCHYALAEALRAYIDAAGIAEDRKGWLFRTARGRKADTLSERPMWRGSGCSASSGLHPTVDRTHSYRFTQRAPSYRAGLQRVEIATRRSHRCDRRPIPNSAP
jgi:site-specific recombinase XerD